MVRRLAHALLSSPWIAGPLGSRPLQPAWDALYRLSLMGMNYGGGYQVETSGEAFVLDLLERRSRARGRGPALIFDVGAHEGEYTTLVRERQGPEARVHAFEPSPRAFGHLARRHGQDQHVALHNVGLSDRPGEATLFSTDPGSTISSLHSGDATGDSRESETCRLTTLDLHCASLGIEFIDLLKMDVEGNEFQVLKGASGLLDRRAIVLIQFEFGEAQINARRFFKDIFQLLHPRYRLHRVLRNGLQPIDRYEIVHEVFRTTNYLAIARPPAE